MRLKTGLLLATSLIMLPLLAEAENMYPAASSPGYYVGGAVGQDFQHDADIEGSVIDQEVDFDDHDGWAGAGMLGYRYGNGFRTELEVDYRKQNVESTLGSTGTGEVNAWSAQANVIYDFANERTALTPYVGLGAGIARVEYDGVSPIGGSRISDDDVVPVVQGIVGAQYPVMPALDVFADYRHVYGFGPEYRTASGVSVDAPYQTGTVLVGVKYNFGVQEPAPAAVPVPPPAPAAPVAAPVAPVSSQPVAYSRSYIVFFDFDKSAITAEASAIITAAVSDALSGQYTRLELTGHADRSGKDGYNMNLSKRRADAVRNAMIKLGVPSDNIVVYAKGESQPLVQTADGVKEPQNRRVEIVYSVTK